MTALLFIFIVNLPVLSSSVAASPTAIPTYEITTREIFDKPWQGVNESAYVGYQPLDINNLYNACPAEVAIVVHGWYLNELRAQERFDRVRLSLENNSYHIPIVGFSWPSDTPWVAAKLVAEENGPKLANFTSDLVNTCKEKQNRDVKIRLVGHSLGARVILSSLDSLHKDPIWNSGAFKIASVHLMGAAVDNEEVSKDPQDILNDQTNWGTVKSDYGEDIQHEVVEFYNLHNPHDKVLGPNPINPFSPLQIYPSFEGDLALGQNGSQIFPKISLPTNYVDIEVQKEEIPFNIDADGDRLCDDLRLTLKPVKWICMITEAGDSHFGYFGFRDAADITKLKDDGAMNVVVNNWNNVTSTLIT